MTGSSETIAFCHACGAPMDVSMVAPFANVECPHCGKHTRVKREFGPYTLVRRHAVGGMSMVFAARDHTLNREVAVKILSEAYSANEHRIAAFVEEARITASFSHPNVVRVLTTGWAFERFYIAMEFVPGGHFEHQIHERGKIPEAQLLPLAIEVAHGLKAAHAAGLIHRDVKPGNILLDSEGHAKLVDFGLALVTHDGKAKATELWATPYYVPPETVEGTTEDFRSDIYAFGATLYHALAGKPSCDEESMATDVLREAKKRVLPLGLAAPSISRGTSQLVERAMAYHPHDRFSSYDEMIASLETVLNRLKSGVPDVTDSATAVRRMARRRQTRMSVLAGVLGVAAICGLALGWANRRAQAPPPASIPKPVRIEPAPLLVDPSAEVMKSYRKVRAAVKTREFAMAANEFVALRDNPTVQEPTRTWAGVEAVLADYLDGNAPNACLQARATVDHMRSLPPGSPDISQPLLATLTSLDQLPPLAVPPPESASAASQVTAAMLAGLKNWEQGLPGPAAACFNAVIAVKLPPDDEWAAIYQGLARDYLADYQILSGPVFTSQPADRAACENAIRELDAVLPTLKTRGRAAFNARAWKADLARQAKLSPP
jgi:tRNA A-37 threonylcarbamoyl transferase component Bud32